MSDVFALQLALPVSTFAPTSRYHGLETAQVTIGDVVFVYVRRRFVPQPEKLAIVGEHQVRERERLDQIAARHIGDPELFWRICDANRAMRPEELTEVVGRRIAISLPEGVPGIPHA